MPFCRHELRMKISVTVHTQKSTVHTCCCLQPVENKRNLRHEKVDHTQHMHGLPDGAGAFCFAGGSQSGSGGLQSKIEVTGKKTICHLLPFRNHCTLAATFFLINIFFHPESSAIEVVDGRRQVEDNFLNPPFWFYHPKLAAIRPGQVQCICDVWHAGGAHLSFY